MAELVTCRVCKTELPTTAYPASTLTKKYPDKRCKDCNARATKRYMTRIKDQVFELLGNKCNWPECNWADKRALCIDHVNGDGFKTRDCTRRQRGMAGRLPGWKAVLKNPENYQLLCANHNMIKAKEIDPILRKGMVN